MTVVTVRVVQADVFNAELPAGDARLVYADPPYTDEDYFGYGARPAWEDLIERMVQLGAPDCAYVLHMGVANLSSVLPAVERLAPKRRRHFKGAPRGRVLAWVKQWSAWRPGVAFQYSWEPVVVFYGPKYRNPASALAATERDWVSCEPQRPRFGHPTEKPDRVLTWLFDRLLVDCAGRSMVDLFAGTGSAAIMAARYGLHATAVERNAKYCRVIRQRAVGEHEPRLTPLELMGTQLRIEDAMVEPNGEPRWTTLGRIKSRKRRQPSKLGGGLKRKTELTDSDRLAE